MQTRRWRLLVGSCWDTNCFQLYECICVQGRRGTDMVGSVLVSWCFIGVFYSWFGSLGGFWSHDLLSSTYPSISVNERHLTIVTTKHFPAIKTPAEHFIIGASIMTLEPPLGKAYHIISKHLKIVLLTFWFRIFCFTLAGQKLWKCTPLSTFLLL